MPQDTPRRALVTGASEFIGARLTRRLVDEGWRVTIIARDSSNLDPLGDAASAVTVHRAAGDIDALIAALADAAPAVAFHFAGHYVGNAGPDDVAPLIEANVGFTARLAEALSRAGVRHLVAAGTGWQHSGPGGIAERAPNGLYAASKQAGEDILAHYADNRGLTTIMLKILDSYGPGDPRGKLMHRLCDAARTGERLPMSPGAQHLGLVHVDDIVDACLVAAARLDAGETGHAIESFVLAPPALPTLKEIVELVGTVAGRPVNADFGALPYRSFDVMEPLHGPVLPGWTARVPLADGIRELLVAADGA